MFDWIWDNRQWLFSGLGVVGTAGVVKLILFFHRRVKVVAVQNGSDSAPTIQPSANRVPVLSLSAEKILTQIRSLPPLQQEDSFNSYKGTRIRYVGLVNFIRKGENETANLELYQPDSVAKVVFSVPLSDYPELKHLRQATPIVAEGTLRHLSSDNEFHLDSVMLSQPSDTPSGTPGVTMDRTEAYTALRRGRYDWGLDLRTRDAVNLAMSCLFPEFNGFALRGRITPERQRWAIETLATLKSKRTDNTEQRAIDRAIDSLNGITITATNTPPSTQ